MTKFGTSGENMNEFEKMMLEFMVKQFDHEGQSATVFGVGIDLNPIGVAAHTNGNNVAFKELGLEEEFKQFADEVSPIVEKYAQVVANRYKSKYEEFKNDSHSGGTMVDPELKEMFMDALKELLP